MLHYSNLFICKCTNKKRNKTLSFAFFCSKFLFLHTAYLLRKVWVESIFNRTGRLIDCGINLYIQKEQLTLLDDEGHPALFAPIMIVTLSTCAQLERDNISFRLLSGRKQYIEKGGKLGRKVGSVKTAEQMKAEYREVISLLRKGYSIRDVAKLSGKGVSTVQRVKQLLKVQSLQ